MDSALKDIELSIDELTNAVADYKKKRREQTDDPAMRATLNYIHEMIKFTLDRMQKTDLDKGLEGKVEWLLGEITELRAMHIEPPPHLDFTRIE